MKKAFIQNLTRLLLAALCSGALWGCAGAPKTNLVPDLYPAAIMAEPIKLRAGFTHTTQPFEIAGPDQVWEVNVGFARHDDVLPFERLYCLLTSPKAMSTMGGPVEKKCLNSIPVPGIHAKWELLRSDGTTLPGITYDALIKGSSSQWTRKSVLIGMGAFSKQAVGRYRLKVTVLRDFSELDVTDPHIVIDKPFFRQR